MNDTPRTDAETHDFVLKYGSDMWNIECVDVDFARELEREIARLREALGDLLEDTQHKHHNCGSDDCPVLRARAALTAQPPEQRPEQIPEPAPPEQLPRR